MIPTIDNKFTNTLYPSLLLWPKSIEHSNMVFNKLDDEQTIA